MFKISISEKFFNSDLPLDPDFPYNLDQMKQALQNLQKSFPTAAKQTSLKYTECNQNQHVHDWFPGVNGMLWVGDILLQDTFFFFLPLWFLKLKGELWRKCKTYNIPIWKTNIVQLLWLSLAHQRCSEFPAVKRFGVTVQCACSNSAHTSRDWSKGVI